MHKLPWFQSLKVVALGLAVLGASGCSRGTIQDMEGTQDPGSVDPQYTATVAANPAAYQPVRVQSQVYAAPNGAQPHGYAAPGEAPVAADPNDPNAVAVADPNAVAADPQAAAEAVPDPADLVGYETLSDGSKVKVVTYVHSYPEPIESYPRVYWSDRWYYNVNGNFVFYSPYYGGWTYYWGPPYPLVYAWNGYYPWAPYAYGYGYYGRGYYWGGAGYHGWHAYGAAPANYQPTHRPGTPSQGGPSGSNRHSMNASQGGPSGGSSRPFDDKRPGPAGVGSSGSGRPQGLAAGPAPASRPGAPGNLSAGSGPRRVAGTSAPTLAAQPSSPGRGYTAPGTTAAFSGGRAPGATAAAGSYRPTYAPSALAYPSNGGGSRGSHGSHGSHGNHGNMAAGGGGSSTHYRPSTYTAGGSRGSMHSPGRSSYVPSDSGSSFRGSGNSYSGGGFGGGHSGSSSSFGGGRSSGGFSSGGGGGGFGGGSRGGGGGFGGGGGGGGGGRGGGGFSGGGGGRGR